MTARPPRPPRDSKAELLDAARAAIRDREDAAVRAAVARNTPARRKRRVGAGLLVALTGLAFLLVRPDWLVGPEGPPPEPAIIATASARITLLRERQRLLDYQARHGRLPETLADAEITTTDLEYQRLGTDNFRLTARVGDSVVTISATDSMRPFLGNSLKVLQRRGRP